MNKQDRVLFSVILPTYNRKHCICKMIDSVLTQDFVDFELIIVDDGSSDNTAEMIQARYTDERIVFVRQENGGVSSARNLGISLAKGKYITFVDSDDYLLNGFFEDIDQTLREFDCDVLVYGGYVFEQDLLREIPLFFGDREYGSQEVMIKDGIEFFKDFCLLSGNSWGCAKVFRSEFIRSNQLIFNKDIKYGEDMLFNIQAYLKASKVVTSPKKYYVCDIQEKSLSRGMLNAKQKLENLILTYECLEDYKEWRAYLALNCMRHCKQWILLGYFRLDQKYKKQLQSICDQIFIQDCTRLERLAKKNLYCALSVYPALLFVRSIYAKFSFIHPITSPILRVIKKAIYLRR